MRSSRVAARSSSELGIDPSPRLQQLHAAILRQEIDLVPARAVPAQDHFEDVARASSQGRVVPVLGTDVGGAARFGSRSASATHEDGARATLPSRRAVRRRDEGLRAALRRAPRAPRRRPAAHAGSPLLRVAAPRCSASAALPHQLDRDDELRPGAREGVRRGGRGGRRRVLSRRRPQPRPLLPRRARRRRHADRGAEHLRHRALAGAAAR